MYALLRAHRTFEDLGTFTLASGLRDVRRIQRAKEEQSRAADTKGKSRATEEVYDQPHEEKQKMLDRENSLGISSREQSADNLTEVRVVPRDTPPQEETASPQPLVSPTIEQTTLSNFPSAVSEKARGKMPERRSLSLDTDNSLDRVTASAVGRNGFVPTQEWVRAVSSCVVDVSTLTTITITSITGDIVAARVCRALMWTRPPVLTDDFQPPSRPGDADDFRVDAQDSRSSGIAQAEF